MAESPEMRQEGPSYLRQREQDVPNDANANGYPIVPALPPVAELGHRTTSTSNETHPQRDQSPVERVEPVDLPARPLNKWDVASLIINKMIGTGIFTAPPTVLLMAGSPGLAFGLWILGFAYTIVRCDTTQPAKVVITYTKANLLNLWLQSVCLFILNTRENSHTPAANSSM
jgi:hypothetical protein